MIQRSERKKQRLLKLRTDFLKRINKIDKPLDLRQKERRFNKIRNARDVTTDIPEMKIRQDYHEQLYINKFNILEEIKSRNIQPTKLDS